MKFTKRFRRLEFSWYNTFLRTQWKSCSKHYIHKARRIFERNLIGWKLGTVPALEK